MLANRGSEPEEDGGRVGPLGSLRVSAPFLQELVPGCQDAGLAQPLPLVVGWGREGTDLGVPGPGAKL